MINSDDVMGMVEHWLSTPPNGYFGQSYGADLRAMLLRELSADNADKLLERLRRDIPLLNQFDDTMLSIQSEQSGFDKLNIYLMLGNIAISIGEVTTATTNQDYYDVRAQ